jgi:hypothetical protein
MLPIVFYFPYLDVGGVSILFLRLAAIVSRDRRVIIMDMENGYMARHIPNRCEFIPYNKPNLLPTQSILVTQSCPLWRIPNISQFPANTKIFYWNLYSYNLSPSLSNTSKKLLKPFAHILNWFNYFRKRKLESLVRYLHAKKSIYFMDKKNVEKTKFFFELYDFNESYLPIMTGELNGNYDIKTPRDNFLKCVWIGRLDDFKIPILLHTIKRLDQIESLSLSLDIIGNGSMRQLVSNECDKCKRLKTRVLGSISHNDLENTLSKYHLLFAMGTSALEGAKIGLPTICVGFSYNNLEGLYRYKMLYTNIGFNVGEEITRDNYEKSSTLVSLLKNIMNNYQDEMRLSFQHWKSNHDPHIVTNRFIDAVEQSDCRIQDLIARKYHKADIFTLLTAIVRGKSKGISGFILS